MNAVEAAVVAELAGQRHSLAVLRDLLPHNGAAIRRLIDGGWLRPVGCVAAAHQHHDECVVEVTP